MIRLWLVVLVLVIASLAHAQNEDEGKPVTKNKAVTVQPVTGPSCEEERARLDIWAGDLLAQRRDTEERLTRLLARFKLLVAQLEKEKTELEAKLQESASTKQPLPKAKPKDDDR